MTDQNRHKFVSRFKMFEENRNLLFKNKELSANSKLFYCPRVFLTVRLIKIFLKKVLHNLITPFLLNLFHLKSEIRLKSQGYTPRDCKENFMQ